MPKIIDLSRPISNKSADPSPQRITYHDHTESDFLESVLFGINPHDHGLDPNLGLSHETLKLSSHAGTHVDAPYHFGPEVEGSPAKTIDQIPLEWCYGCGVLLDFSDCPPGYVITPDDLKEELDGIDHELKSGEIPLLRTGADKYSEISEFLENQCGLGAEGLEWLLNRGIKTIGTDAFTLDTSIPHMTNELIEGRKENFFPVHLQVGGKREHIHAEKLANLDQLPRPFGFKVAMFPVKIEGASGAWARVVAIFEDE